MLPALTQVRAGERAQLSCFCCADRGRAHVHRAAVPRLAMAGGHRRRAYLFLDGNSGQLQLRKRNRGWLPIFSLIIRSESEPGRALDARRRLGQVTVAVIATARPATLAPMTVTWLPATLVEHELRACGREATCAARAS
jgi:hypothetical protein